MKTAGLCRKLRSKSMFMPAVAEEAAGQPDLKSLRTSHCWCNCTLTETGPDDRPVGPDVCNPSRPCFEE
jgi:hypothetical protein